MRTTSALALATAVSGSSAPAIAQPFQISWHSIDGGGGTSAGGPLTLSGTIGQHDAGAPMFGGVFQLTGGFWAGRVEPCRADFNGDGNVNLFDFLAFQTAFGNEEPAADLAPPFGAFNLFDFLAFQTAFGNGC